jgi:preprotein translocase subunit SecG
MPGKIIAAAALLVIGTLLGILSELKSDDKTDNTKKKKNNVIKYISLALMFTALILSFKILIKENKDNSEKDNKHKEEYESTINKLNATIIKSDSLLDSLRGKT